MGFIFGGDTPWTYEQLQAKRALADRLMYSMGRAPRNVGEGLTALGNALAYRGITRRANKRQAELKSAFDKKFSGMFPAQATVGRAPTMPMDARPTWDAQDPRQEAAMTDQRSNPIWQGDIAQYGDSVANIESGGDYSKLGHVTDKGDRAYGRYQVMGSNIPGWTEQALGRKMTPQEFLASPEAQDEVYKRRFGGYVDKYGNPQDAASAWFSGHPMAGNTREDILGTSVPQYVANFNAGLGQTTPMSQAIDPQKLVSIMSDPMAAPAQKQYASALLQQQFAAQKPMTALERVQLEQAKLNLAQDYNSPTKNDNYGVTPIMGTDKDGNRAAIQVSNKGGVNVVELPDGFRLDDPNLIKVDTGTGTILINKKTG